MQAGLVTTRLTWGEIFVAGRPAVVVMILVVDVAVIIRFGKWRPDQQRTTQARARDARWL